MSSNMLRRVLVAAIGIPAALALVYLGGWVLAALLALFGAAGALELYRLAERSALRPVAPAGVVGAALLPLAAFAALPDGGGVAPAWLAVGGAVWLMAALAATMRWRTPADRPLAAAALTVFGALYAGGMPAFLLALRHGGGLAPWPATGLVFLPLALTWVGDSLAMAGGTLVGGAKLAPVLSPNKTWAGAVSGAVGAVLLAPLYGALVLAPAGITLAVWQLAVFGLVISVLGQAGDVAESLFKREAGVKDSGAFFPGHGGVLDRFDSLYWALPAAVLLLMAYGLL